MRSADGRRLRVALIGAGLMARSHALAYASVPVLFPDLGVRPELAVLAATTEAGARDAAAQLGVERGTANWREAVADPSIDVVDIVTPNALHHEIALAAIAAGKHVYCEKPLALTAAGARQLWEAACAAGVRTLVGFSYLAYPGVQLARQLVADGTLGEVWTVRAHFITDANADPALPRTWHYERAKAGFGALGDIGSHVVSLVEAVAGPIAQVFAELATVVPLRPEAPGARSYGSAAAADARLLPVENDDITVVLARLASVATAVLEANRVGNGHPFDIGIEVIGSEGSVRFSQQESHRVELYLRGRQPVALNGTTTLALGPSHPDYGAYWPLPGITIGLHEVKAIEVRTSSLRSGTRRRPFRPSGRAGGCWRSSKRPGGRACAAAGSP